MKRMKITLTLISAMAAIAVGAHAEDWAKEASEQASTLVIEAARHRKPTILTGQLFDPTCNGTYGIGEVSLAVFDPATRSFTVYRLNVVSEALCPKKAWGPTKLGDMTWDSIIGDPRRPRWLEAVSVNSAGIAPSITEVEATRGELKAAVRELNLREVDAYPVVDKRIVDLLKLHWDEAVMARVPELLALAKKD